jgi:hypothetical protein
MIDEAPPIAFGLSLQPSVDLVGGNRRPAQDADTCGVDHSEFLDTRMLTVTEV